MRAKDFPYCSQSSRMLCSVRYGSQGGRLGFLWIKDKSLVGSPYIRDGTWEHSPYWHLSFHRGGITQPLNGKLPGLKTPEHVSNLDL